MEHLLLYQDDPKKLNHFYIKLLKPLPGWRLVSPENWFESLAKECKKRDLEVDFPVPSTMSTILTIPLPQRLEILRNLCEFHLEQPEHFWELLKGKDGEADWRIEPIGKDSTNRRYWLFSDGRLYREKEATRTRNKKNLAMSWDIEDENNWELVCLSRSDYDEFIETLKKEKQFLKLIKEEIIPKVEPILQFQLAQHRKYFRPVATERICLLPRKRSSRLVQKEIEEEQRRLEREAAEKEAEKERQAIRRALLADKVVMPQSQEQQEKDLAAEREMRAEMRRIKKEKELQIKEIEEAFYAKLENQNESDDVEIVEDMPEIPVTAPSSPIKLVLKLSKPQEPVENEEKAAKDNEEVIDVQKSIEPSNDSMIDVTDVPVFDSNVDIVSEPLIDKNYDIISDLKTEPVIDPVSDTVPAKSPESVVPVVNIESVSTSVSVDSVIPEVNTNPNNNQE